MKAEIAERVLERANGYCEKCGQVGYDFALHHRKLKSQGGQDAVSNLIAVHHACHNMGTKAIHMNPKEAVENGWIVPGWADSTTYPLVLPDGTSVLLDDEGSYIPTERQIHGTD